MGNLDWKKPQEIFDLHKKLKNVYDDTFKYWTSEKSEAAARDAHSMWEDLVDVLKDTLNHVFVPTDVKESIEMLLVRLEPMTEGTYDAYLAIQDKKWREDNREY